MFSKPEIAVCTTLTLGGVAVGLRVAGHHTGWWLIRRVLGVRSATVPAERGRGLPTPMTRCFEHGILAWAAGVVPKLQCWTVAVGYSWVPIVCDTNLPLPEGERAGTT